MILGFIFFKRSKCLQIPVASSIWPVKTPQNASTFQWLGGFTCKHWEDDLEEMENIKNRNYILPYSPHNNSEHEDTNEDDGVVEDDDNHNTEPTAGFPKPDRLSLQMVYHPSGKNVLKHCLCELFECSESENVWQQPAQNPQNFLTLSLHCRARA